MTANEAAIEGTADKPAGTSAWRWLPLRLCVFFFGLLALYAGCMVLFNVANSRLKAAPQWALWLGTLLITAVVMIGAYRLLVRWTEKRTATEIGWTGALPGFAEGALLGIGLFCAVYAVLWAQGAVTFLGYNAPDRLVVGAEFALVAGIAEEIIFRGGLYRLVEDGFGTLVALIVSGAVFGALHGFNPGATVASSLAIAIEAGVMLGAAYALTRSLWLPIGLHFGWNFTEGGVFGALVSGGHAKGYLITQLSGPVQLTGGAFGPEASVPAVVVCFAAGIALVVLCIARQQWKPLAFRLRD